MALEDVFGPGSNPSGLVDKIIGDAFPIVRHVSNNIEYVKHVSAHLPEVYRVWESIDNLDTLYNSIDQMQQNVDYVTEKVDQFGSIQETIDATEAIRIATNTQGQGKVDAAQAQVVLATQQANLAAISKNGTDTDRNLTANNLAQAITARVAAETARDAALAGGTVYPDITTGRAAVVDNNYFKVIGTNEISFSLYKRLSSSTEALVTQQPSTAAILARPKAGVFESLIPSVGAFTITDPDNRELIRIYPNTVSILPVERIGVPSDYPTLPLVTDYLGRVLLSVPTVDENIYTSVSTLENRVNNFHTISGIPLEPVYGAWRMRKIKLALSQISYDVIGAKAAIAVFGDSWCDDPQQWLAIFWKQMVAKYGDGGIGYVDFGNGGAQLRPDVTRTFAGPRTTIDGTIAGPSLYAMQWNASGGKLTIQAANTTPVLSNAELLWNGSSDGVIRYRWNAGSWNNLNVQGTGFQHAVLTGYPVSGAWTLELEWVAGTTRIYGALFPSAQEGITIHKLGNNGTQTTHWIGVDATEWQAALAYIKADAVMCVLGTNDKSASRAASVVAENIGIMNDRVKAALPSNGDIPSADFIAIIPPVIPREALSTPLLMDDYWKSVLEISNQKDMTVISLVPIFGNNPNDKRSWFDASGYHASTDIGGTLVNNVILKEFGL